MAYCVQCGVELHPSETRCPLCGCPVHLPVKPVLTDTQRPYPPATENQRLRTSPYALLLISALFLLLPALICLTVDLLNTGTVTWSIYPGGALGMIFLPLAAVILAQHHRAEFAVISADVAICLFLWMIQTIKGGTWFSAVVFPALVLSGMGALAILYSAKKKVLQGLSVAAVSLMMMGMIALAVDLLLSARVGLLRVQWSIFVLIPCAVVAIMLWIIQRSPSLRSLLGRVFHL